jgi:hypothetical protein
MPLVRSFFTSRVWMREIYQRIRQILELGEPGEFRTIVCRDRLEHLREMLTIFLRVCQVKCVSLFKLSRMEYFSTRDFWL